VTGMNEIPRLGSGCFDELSISARGSDAAQSPQFGQQAPAPPPQRTKSGFVRGAPRRSRLLGGSSSSPVPGTRLVTAAQRIVPGPA